MSRKEVLFQYYYEHIRHNIVNFLKWLVLAVLTGLIVGGASGIFAKCIGAATAYRDAHIRFSPAAICRTADCVLILEVRKPGRRYQPGARHDQVQR